MVDTGNRGVAEYLTAVVGVNVDDNERLCVVELVLAEYKRLEECLADDSDDGSLTTRYVCV